MEEEQIDLSEFEQFAKETAESAREEDGKTPAPAPDADTKQDAGATPDALAKEAHENAKAFADLLLGVVDIGVSFAMDRYDRGKGWKKRNNRLTPAEKAAIRPPLTEVCEKYAAKLALSPELKLAFVVVAILVVRAKSPGEPKDDAAPASLKDTAHKKENDAAPYGRKKDGTPKAKPGRK